MKMVQGDEQQMSEKHTQDEKKSGRRSAPSAMVIEVQARQRTGLFGLQEHSAHQGLFLITDWQALWLSVSESSNCRVSSSFYALAHPGQQSCP
jgi:hypothetical protein